MAKARRTDPGKSFRSTVARDMILNNRSHQIPAKRRWETDDWLVELEDEDEEA